jgi:two-component system, OmpR family, sensor kinase
MVLTLAAIFISLRLAFSQILYSDVESDLSENTGRVAAHLFIRGTTEERAVQDLVNQYLFPLVVRDLDGNVIATNNPGAAAATRLSSDEIGRIAGRGDIIDSTTTIQGEEFRVRSTRLVLANEPAGVIQVGRSTDAISQVMQAMTVILLGGGAIAVVVVLGAGYALARRALRPIEEMTELAAEIEASDLTQRIGVQRKPAEVQRLADTFDAMLARLESAFGQQRNFVMDVSHELRTPLTGLRGNLDVLLMDRNLDEQTRVQLERMSSEVARLIRLTSNLLYLAHAEAGREIARRPVELDELCLEVVHQARMAQSDVNLRLAHEEHVTVPGDRDLLKQLVLNLVDNGMKYTPSGGEVVVSLFQGPEGARIVVEDNGPGIQPDQLDQIFERFYRGSNSDARSVGGAGIGLAISRWIARVHGGDITVESEIGRGSRFIVSLPLHADPAETPAPAYVEP